MNNFFKTLAFMALTSLLFTSCNKDGVEKDDYKFGDENPILFLESGYTSKIITPLEQPSDFEYYTKGLIEYSYNGNIIATLDFGDGTKDKWAIKTRDGVSSKVDLSAKKTGDKYTKVITKPLIKIAGCNYIVAGTIKYFLGKDWVATVDYGNGTCDEWATKTWKNGSKTFSLQK